MNCWEKYNDITNNLGYVFLLSMVHSGELFNNILVSTLIYVRGFKNEINL